MKDDMPQPKKITQQVLDELIQQELEEDYTGQYYETISIIAWLSMVVVSGATGAGITWYIMSGAC